MMEEAENSLVEIGIRLNDNAYQLSALADSLRELSSETIAIGNFDRSATLALSYECLAKLVLILAQEIAENHP